MVKAGDRIRVSYLATVLDVYDDGAVWAMPDGMTEAPLEYLPGEYVKIEDE